MTQTDAPTREQMLEELKAAVTCQLITDAETFGDYLRDASPLEPEGMPYAVLVADSTENVSAAMKWANSYKVPVSVRGLGSGLAGGAVAYKDGLVIALDKMNRIKNIDVENKLADVEAGVINAELDAAAHEHGLFFAPDPASAAISTIGGNIATNAGGLRCVAHGVTLESVAALEVVLANGDVIQTGSRTVKNVSGLNLTQLFVGSEGVLGIITGATVRLKPAPVGDPYTFSAHFDTLTEASQAVIAVVNQGRPESLEMLDAQSVEAIERHLGTGLKVPGAALVMGATVGADACDKAEAIVELCKIHGASEVAVAKGHELMDARRQVHPVMKAEQMQCYGDVGVPMSKLPVIMNRIQEISAQTGKKIFIAAHAGDGNLHPTVESGTTDEQYQEALGVLDVIVEATLELGGTVTGEHGIGALKRHELPMQYSPQTLAAQVAIKKALDPNNILTPGRAI